MSMAVNTLQALVGMKKPTKTAVEAAMLTVGLTQGYIIQLLLCKGN